MGNVLRRLLHLRDEFHRTYKLNEVVGSGTFATVHRATNRRTGEIVAVKIIEKQRLTSDELAIVHNEMQIMHRIRHRNCVRLIEVFESHRCIHLVMELLGGGELFDRVSDRNFLTERDAARVIASVATGLEYLHSLGITHRDLKPENIMFTSRDPANAVVKVTDFGLARFRALHSTTLMSTACGTPNYIAPEMLDSRPYTNAVDMWSLGVILYITLCGFPPFYSENIDAMFELVRKARYGFPAPYWINISAHAKDLVRRLLCADPAKRFSARQVLNHQWIREHSPDSLPVADPSAERRNKLHHARLAFRRLALIVTAVNRMTRETASEGGGGADAVAKAEGELDGQPQQQQYAQPSPSLQPPPMYSTPVLTTSSAPDDTSTSGITVPPLQLASAPTPSSSAPRDAATNGATGATAPATATTTAALSPADEDLSMDPIEPGRVVVRTRRVHSRSSVGMSHLLAASTPRVHSLVVDRHASKALLASSSSITAAATAASATSNATSNHNAAPATTDRSVRGDEVNTIRPGATLDEMAR